MIVHTKKLDQDSVTLLKCSRRDYEKLLARMSHKIWKQQRFKWVEITYDSGPHWHWTTLALDHTGTGIALWSCLRPKSLHPTRPAFSTSHSGHLRSLGKKKPVVTLWFIPVAKLQLWSSNKNKFMVGRVTTACRIGLKSHSIRNFENHCCRLYWTWERR